jgi:hypothetical protein
MNRPPIGINIRFCKNPFEWWRPLEPWQVCEKCLVARMAPCEEARKRKEGR